MINETNIINHYKIQIYERYRNLLNAGLKASDLDNNHLWKIFEYLSCIKLSEERNSLFYEYNDIDPSFKEVNQMTRTDTGIDASNLIDTIVQCKLRKDALGWRECSTFFGSQTCFDEELGKTIVRWQNLIITRNAESTISENLFYRKKLFIDKTFSHHEIIGYCEDLMKTPPEYPVSEISEFNLRDYQNEAIQVIHENKNSIICIPTGCGKNIIMIYSMIFNKKYLILVPRIILMEQLNDEILLHKPELKSRIQMIGDGNNVFDKNALITICVYNSVNIVMDYAGEFEKIYVDEAHHIEKPEIYRLDEESDSENDSESDIDDNESDFESNFDSDYDLDSLDDSEDELKKSNYITSIRELSKYKNNVYLSATIDEISDFTYYKKDIRDMIEQKYLTDYTIHIPIFNDDPSNKNICEYILNNYKNMIIYCNSQKEGQQINKMMNDILNKSCDYLDCNTSRVKRNDIITRFKSGFLPFLVNVRILIEGFNAEITKGVIFMHLPKASTTLIQIIGRALRLHGDKKYANIVLPYSCDEDTDNISNFLRVIANNDKRIKKSYERKELGGYILFDLEEDEKDEDYDCEEKSNIQFKFDMVYNSMGKLKNVEEIWEFKKNLLFEYVGKFGFCPKEKERYNNCNIGTWLQRQKSKINTNKDDIYKILSVNKIIKNNLDKYLDDKEKNKNKIKIGFEDSLKLLVNFVELHKKCPIKSDIYNDKKIGYFFQFIKKKIYNSGKYNNYIYNLLEDNIILKESIDKYIENKEITKNSNKVKLSFDDLFKILLEFISKENRCPHKTELYNDIKIGLWLSNQKNKILKKDYKLYIILSENEIIKNNLDKYLEEKEKNKTKVKITKDFWYDLFFEFIKLNKRCPDRKETYKEFNLGNWFHITLHQRKR